ncbi:MAG: superoxide dismutase family protein [Candidatus Tectomicrobia bacterium]|uniref:Superoxide dismutase family protein n=1 Tax=Tectimicrobiota bacterium TaxID=2528274 RepID=A0A932FUI3_UNCTE|nr:superoxide dismutase family protein [Candidatus Tectomicrobia bacterium]
MGYALPGLPPASQAAEPISKAVAVLHPTKGQKVRGVVSFTRVGEKIRVVADLEGLTPGLHGFHVHEYGDCTAPDGNSAGGHFNPEGMPHAAPTSTQRHAGDLGNVEANATGKAHLDLLDPILSFEGPRSIVGRGIVVHAQADDLKSQPAGAAGARVACGAIGIAKP